MSRPEPRSPDAGVQLALRLAHRAAGPAPLGVALAEYGFSCYSQTDEDGILLYLFALAGTMTLIAWGKTMRRISFK